MLSIFCTVGYMENKRYLLYHDGSDSLFEVINAKEVRSCVDNGCDDVTGNEVWEKLFRSQALFNEFIRSGDKPSPQLMKRFVHETNKLMVDDEVAILNYMMHMPDKD